MIKSNLDWQKYLLFAGMAAVAFMLLLRYSDFRDQKKVAIDTTTISVTNTPTTVSVIQASSSEALASNDMIPQSPDEVSLVSASVAPQQLMIHIVTDSLDVLIDRQGGDIIKVALPRHFAQIDTPDQPFVLLNRTENTTYIAQSGLIGANGTDKPGQRPLFTSTNTEYRMLVTTQQRFVIT